MGLGVGAEGAVALAPALRSLTALTSLNLCWNDMRAEGAFLVSAVRQGGMTRAVRVRSLAGEPCRVEADIAEVRVSAPRGWKQTDGGVLELDLRKGEEAVLYAPEWQPGLIIEPVAGTGPSNPFGLKANH